MKLTTVAAATALLLSVDLAAAQGKSGGQKKGDAKDAPNVQLSVIFRDSDRAVYRDYFVANPIKAKPLPPGIAKNLARGKPLPPGIAKQVLPARLVAIAPRPAPGITIVIVGDRLVALRDGLVVDIMLNVVF